MAKSRSTASSKSTVIVNAKQYAFQGVPFTPAFQVFPGMPVPDLLRALQAAQGQQQASAAEGQIATENKPAANPPAAPAKGAANAPSEKSDSEADSPPKK